MGRWGLALREITDITQMGRNVETMCGVRKVQGVT